MNIKIGMKVVPNISRKAGQEGQVTSFGKNPALPVGVTFPDEKFEWDFHQSEVKEVEE